MADRSGNLKPVQFGDDGELLSGVFCVKCGTLNPHEVQFCQKCGDILAEQGPDLPKRLARIRRHASQTRTDAPSPSYHTGQFETFVGKTAQVRKSRFMASKRYADMNRYYRHVASDMPLVPAFKDKQRRKNFFWKPFVLLDLLLNIVFWTKGMIGRVFHYVASKMPVVPEIKDKERKLSLIWRVFVLLDLTLIILFFAKVLSQTLFH
jgi:hypothetical protein